MCFVLLTKYCTGDEIKKENMGGECGMNGVEEKWIVF